MGRSPFNCAVPSRPTQIVRSASLTFFKRTCCVRDRTDSALCWTYGAQYDFNPLRPDHQPDTILPPYALRARMRIPSGGEQNVAGVLFDYEDAGGRHSRLLPLLSPSEIDSLRAAQRAWLEYVKADARFVTEREGDGSSGRLIMLRRSASDIHEATRET